MSWIRERSLWLGVVVVLLLGMLSWWLAQFAPRIGSVTIAIVLGVVAGNALFHNEIGEHGGAVAEKHLLPLAIVLLGVELQLMTLLALGPLAAIVILLSISTSIFASIQLGKLLGFSPEFSMLMGAGNGICGSSAVAATSMAIEAEEADTGISISVVNLLGTLGIFLIPAVIRWLSLSDMQGGLLVGGTLQAFGQVVAAGFSVNDDVGNIATVVKMGRILMLGPVVVLLGSWLPSRAAGEGKSRANVRVPRFIFGFFLLSVIASIGVLPPALIEWIKEVGRFLLVVAMVGIGMRIQLRTLFRSGARALLFGAIIATIQTTVTLVWLLAV